MTFHTVCRGGARFLFVLNPESSNQGQERRLRATILAAIGTSKNNLHRYFCGVDSCWRDLSCNHDKSTLHRSETNGISERVGRRVDEAHLCNRKSVGDVFCHLGLQFQGSQQSRPTPDGRHQPGQRPITISTTEPLNRKIEIWSLATLQNLPNAGIEWSQGSFQEVRTDLLTLCLDKRN